MSSIFTKLGNELKTLRRLWHHRLMVDTSTQAKLVEEFTKLYCAYEEPVNSTWHQTTWLGHKILKCPLDLWIYQEMMFELKPDLIIETGTAHGGSALYLAGLCDLLGTGRVVSVDIESDPSRPKHPRIQYLLGSSVSEEILRQVEEAARGCDSVLVILDSDHRQPHVIKELRAYSRFVRKGGYLILEDTFVNGHPVGPDHGPGPMEALQQYLKETDEFVVDKSREKFYLTFNPSGYLKKK